MMPNIKDRKEVTLPVDEQVNKVSIEESKKEVAKMEAPSKKKGKVICQSLNMRKGPTIDSEILRILTKGTEVKILDDTDDTWYKVCVGGVGTGFCMREFIKLGK